MTNTIAVIVGIGALLLLLNNLNDPDGSLIAKFNKRFLGKNKESESE